MNLALFLFVLTLASCLVWIIACWCVWQFSRDRAKTADYTPPVSVLKPVAGLEYQAYRNFDSFCHQDYPADYEVLFGTEDASDPVRPVLERLRREQHHLHIQTVTSEPLGANAKVTNLNTLAASAEYDILVMNDSDMRVTPDYLRQVVAPLHDESVGLVTCLYQGEEATSMAARFGALYVASTYMPLVTITDRLVHIPFAFGSTIAMRRRDLERIGGFKAIADHLADDHELAARVVALGKRVVLAPYVVRNILGSESWRKLWDREVRWIRCARVSRPMEYPGLLLTHTLPLAIATAFVMDFDTLGRNLIAVALCVRWATTWLIAGYLQDAQTRRMLPWLPLRDLMTFAVWCGGLIGREVEWRGRHFAVQPDGRLRPIEPFAQQGVESPISSRRKPL